MSDSKTIDYDPLMDPETWVGMRLQLKWNNIACEKSTCNGFFGGQIKSYDKLTDKHEIIMDDGDKCFNNLRNLTFTLKGGQPYSPEDGYKNNLYSIFSKSTPMINEVKIKIGNTMFYVPKDLLMFTSNVFKTLLNDNHNNSDIIELKDDLHEFKCFLYCINPETSHRAGADILCNAFDIGFKYDSSLIENRCLNILSELKDFDSSSSTLFLKMESNPSKKYEGKWETSLLKRYRRYITLFHNDSSELELLSRKTLIQFLKIIY